MTDCERIICMGDNMYAEIKDCPGYLIYDTGQVFSLKSNKFLKPALNRKYNGRYRVELYGKTLYIHRLVAEAFIPNPENKPTVNHKNGDKLNNDYLNLEWATFSEQEQHAVKLGLHANGSIQRKIACYTLDGEFVRYYEGFKDAGRNLQENKLAGKGADSKIHGVIEHQTKTAYGFRWKYYNGESKS